MHIAIVGAGMAGLALSWHLLQKRQGYKVTLFGIPEEGASRISSGLLHPYPGEQARRSWKADEGLRATKKLLCVAEEALQRPIAREGMIRIAVDEKQRKRLIAKTETFTDIERIGEWEFFISSAVTLSAPLYLEGLLKACKEEGALYYPIKVERVDQLKEYDQVVLACGASIFNFPEAESLKLKLVKGQSLLCEWPSSCPPLKQSLVGKGHLVPTEISERCLLGATYERDFLDIAPCLERASQLLFPRIAAFFPEVGKLKALECYAGLRVTREGSYLPLIQKINSNLWAFTALGSRGLLYHAYFSELLALEL